MWLRHERAEITAKLFDEIYNDRKSVDDGHGVTLSVTTNMQSSETTVGHTAASSCRRLAASCYKLAFTISDQSN